MLTLSYVNIISFFYPIGNTPAVSLTQSIPPNVPADILLLGCGDVRSILFTNHVDGKLLFHGLQSERSLIIMHGT